MKKHILLAFISVSVYSQNLSTNQKSDSLFAIQTLDEVTVKALRASGQTPVSFINITKKELAKINLAQDIPRLIKNTPSVITHSDGGSGIGYSSIRIRGSDQSRINVTINGVPYNDSESMAVYWVDLPDFASSVESIQIQRGVGTSTNGAGAFGGSINIQTNAASEIPTFEINNTIGSFNTIKNSVGFSTGFIDNKFELSGRLSRIKSSGYIDRSGSKLRSYFLQGIYKDENTLVKLLNFAGHEITDQAWFGLDSETLKKNRKYNFAGEYYDDDGNTMYYQNQDDNYKQDHYQLHWNQVFENNLVSNLGLHYTYGRGYFENYNIGYDDGISKSPDFIDRRWLDNDFYGLIFSLNKTTDKYNASIGGSYNIYDGEHYGEYLWYGQNNDLNNNKEYKERFYDDYGNKKEFNIYTKIDFPLSSRLSLYGDLQYRKIYYKADITPYSVITGYVEEGYNSIDKVFNFFNPKFGFILKHHDNSNFYLSYSRAQREPTRTDYANGSPNPEKLDDFELGWKGQFKKISFNLNSFYMLYDDQLVLTGQRDNNGYEIRRNIGESYRLGLELETRLVINSKLDLETNLTISENKNKDFYYKFDGELKSFGNTNLAYSPSIIANNIINFNPNEKVLISLRSNYISEQYFAQINTPISRLDSFLINDLSFIHDISIPNVSNDIKFKVLINNLFDIKYSSYGGHYTYDLMENSQTKTYEGTYYYPQAGINILVALDIKI
tara:strand:+ start:431 stop:2605 length:2175 start_codon:yes stop_codon:yes gene_type:complete